MLTTTGSNGNGGTQRISESDGGCSSTAAGSGDAANASYGWIQGGTASGKSGAHQDVSNNCEAPSTAAPTGSGPPGGGGRRRFSLAQKMSSNLRRLSGAVPELKIDITEASPVHNPKFVTKKIKVRVGLVYILCVCLSKYGAIRRLNLSNLTNST